MNSQGDNISRPRTALVAVLCCGTLLVAAARLLRGTPGAAHSCPLEFSGSWKAVGIDGDARGNIIFAASGQLDANDNFSGRWWFRDNTIVTQWWKTEPSRIIEYLLPHREEFVFTITRDDAGRPALLRGEHVLLTHTGSRSFSSSQ